MLRSLNLHRHVFAAGLLFGFAGMAANATAPAVIPSAAKIENVEGRDRSSGSLVDRALPQVDRVHLSDSGFYLALFMLYEEHRYHEAGQLVLQSCDSGSVTGQ